MAPAAEIVRLELLADEAWPPAVVEEHDGWLLRWAEGPWNRTNSVAPMEAGRAPLAAKIDHAERWYRERRRPPNFKLTPASQPEQLEEGLARRGYEIGFAVSVQRREAVAGTEPAGLHVEPRPTPAWLEAKRRLSGGGIERARHLPTLLARIRAPAAYASMESGGRVAAVGLAVITSGHVGVFDLAVDPHARRRGLATAVVEGLVSWGARTGAATAYLQVETANAPALHLYDKLGFAEVYRYWYRVLRTAA